MNITTHTKEEEELYSDTNADNPTHKLRKSTKYKF